MKSATEIKNDALAAALLRKRELHKRELDEVGASSLSYECYIKIDGKYLQPIQGPGLPSSHFSRVLERRLKEKTAAIRREEIDRQTEMLLQADAHCCNEIFQRLQESVSSQRLAQLKALLHGIKIGTVFGFSFLTVSEDVRVPIKALNRWVGEDTIIKKKRDNETAEQFAERNDKMMNVIHEKVLAWFYKTPRVQGILSAWKGDVQLPVVMAAEGHETRGTQLAR